MCATLALESGRSIRWVAKILDHSDRVLTLRTYAHVLEREDDGMEVLSTAPTPPPFAPVGSRGMRRLVRASGIAPENSTPEGMRTPAAQVRRRRITRDSPATLNRCRFLCSFSKNQPGHGLPPGVYPERA